MTNVVRFGNETLPDEPDEEIIATLEKLLEDARSGELRAIAYGTIRRNSVVGTGWAGVAGTRFPLGAVIGMLSTRYHSVLLEGGKPDG